MKLERLEGSQVKTFFTVERTKFNEAVDKSFELNNSKVKIAGFRPGKAPRSKYEATYGVGSLYNDALDIVVNEIITNELTKSEEFRIVGAPNLGLDFSKLSTEEDFEITLTFDVHPTVELGAYKGIEVKAVDAKVTEEDITNEINRQLKDKAELTLKGKQVIEKGDIAIFDFAGSVDGVAFDGGTAENYELKIGSGLFIPGFEDQMIGMKAGEEKDVNVTFPKAYQAAELAGQEAVFKVKLHEVKNETFPTLTDELVKELNLENISTVEAYKTDLVAKLEVAKTNQENRRFEDELLAKVIENAKIDLPKTYVNNRVSELTKNAEAQAKQYSISLEVLLQFQGMTLEQFNQMSTERAVNDIKLDCILDEIVKAEKLNATDEEVVAFIEKEAAKYNSTKDAFIKQYGKSVFAYNLNIANALEVIKSNAKSTK
ncbi:MAG: trigger factor [bacterium]